jgi:hypothetical protein
VLLRWRATYALGKDGDSLAQVMAAIACDDVATNALVLEQTSQGLPGDPTHMFSRMVYSPKRGSPLIDNGLTAQCSQQDEAGITRPITGSALTPARRDSAAIEWPPTSLWLDGFE